MSLTYTEQQILDKLKLNLNIQHIPVYRNGVLIKISEILDDLIYENRQYAYNAKIFISDEIVYNLNDTNSIRSLNTPLFSEFTELPGVTYDLSYIFKMQACSEKRDNFVVPMINIAFNLMQASHIGWLYKDYMQLVERLWKSGKISQADKLEKILHNRLITFDNANIKIDSFNETLKIAYDMNTDLLVAAGSFDTCEKCSMLQDRVYSISGKNKKYPALPKRVFKYGNFHKGCRHRFFPFIDGFSNLLIHKDNAFVSVDPVKYSNRPYVDTRTAEQKEKYEKYSLKRQSDFDFENLKREYYHKKYYDVTSVPKSFSAYMKEKNFKHIV